MRVGQDSASDAGGGVGAELQRARGGDRARLDPLEVGVDVAGEVEVCWQGEALLCELLGEVEPDEVA